MKVGYWISSHVLQHHVASPILVQSLLACGIDPNVIVFCVNGAVTSNAMTCHRVRHLFRSPDDWQHLYYLASEGWGKKLGVTHWFFLNGTSRCGPEFKRLVETGFDPECDAVSAAGLIPLHGKGHGGRAMNDLAMYRNDYLTGIISDLLKMRCAGTQAIFDDEGLAYALAPKQGFYPIVERKVSGPSDIYGTGTPRITEYFTGIDWYRYKKNWGQMMPPYDATQL